jgi:hypothetical protein
MRRRSLKATRMRRGGDRGPFLAPTAKDWQLNASLDWIPGSHDALDVYAEGYLAAAKIISRAAVRRRSGVWIDALMWPMVFLWRHYCELRLKEVTVSAADLCGVTPKQVTGHDLGMLWKAARPLLVKTGTINARDLAVADGLFVEFARSDQLAEAFRYPTDRKGHRLALSQTKINLRRLKTTFEGLAAALEGASIAISVALSDRPDSY